MEDTVMKEFAISGGHYDKLNEWWQAYVDGLEQSLNLLDKEIKEAKGMQDICTDEWCTATDHYIDDIANAVFTISEPRWASEQDTKRLRSLKKRVHDLYADFRQTREMRGNA
jgi:hypothetical protein